jgi:transcriptional/translational regulatory protein YebC/TACO1
LVVVRPVNKTFDEVLEHAIDLGAEDVEEADDGSIRVDFLTLAYWYQVLVNPDEVSSKAKAFKENGYEVQDAETIWVPLQEVEVDSKQVERLYKVMDELEADDDVTGVYCNFVPGDPLSH